MLSAAVEKRGKTTALSPSREWCRWIRRQQLALYILYSLDHVECNWPNKSVGMFFPGRFMRREKKSTGLL